MSKKLIIFSHHRSDDFTRWSLERAMAYNPGWDFVTMGFPDNDLLPGSCIAEKDKYPSNKALAWISKKNEDWCDPDLFMYEALVQFPEYGEYFLYEYDTVCSTSVDSFFDTSLDFFCNSVHKKNLGMWDYWVQAYRRLNHYGVDEIYSVGQMTCIYFKKHILEMCLEEILCDSILYNGMLSELRMGTIVNKFAEIKKGREDIRDYISWRPFSMKLEGDYFYHPVKRII